MPLYIFLLTLVPASAQAHVKWFVSSGHELPADVARFGLAEPAVQLWLGIGLCLVACSLWLDLRLPNLPQPHGRLRHMAIASLRVLTGMSLLLSTLTGSVIAPHYIGESLAILPLLALQGMTGCLLLFPACVFPAALCLLVLYAGLMLWQGPLEVIEYLNIVGISGFLAFTHHPDPALRAKLQPWAVPVLRISTGMALMVLAFSEKLLRPDYAETFVQTYMWNFMHNMGVTFYTDRLFVLSAGTMEAVLGLILILGSITRLNILVISAFMLTSNIAFFLQGNLYEALTEIVGHLPIIATAIMCVFFGAGQHLRASAFLGPPAPAVAVAGNGHRYP
jgi:hypothetical protein